MKHIFGLVLSGVYLSAVVYLFTTQGLTGESFIAILLGAPWTLLMAAFEFWGAEGNVLTILLVIPLAINAALLYLLGRSISRYIYR